MKIMNESAARVMLGFVPGEIDLVVMTPLTGLFNKIQEMFPERECCSAGFYPVCLMTGPSGKRVLLVKCAQGIQGQDVCCLFRETDFLFLGYAGGISGRVRLGGGYEVSCAVKPDGRETELGWGDILTSGGRKEFERVRIGYSPAMIGEIADECCAAAEEAGCDAVDMEISYCAGTCRSSKYLNGFRALILITDIPGKHNFWEITAEERELIRAGERAMIGAAGECIREVTYDGR